VAEYTMNDVQKLKDRVYDLMERKLLEYGASWIDDRKSIVVNR
jgi:hypothetical protein